MAVKEVPSKTRPRLSAMVSLLGLGSTEYYLFVSSDWPFNRTIEQEQRRYRGPTRGYARWEEIVAGKLCCLFYSLFPISTNH